MEKISIIIPVYKVERYLRECVDSVLASTYTNLEIILVDDGSPDGCPQVCDAYAAQDSRIKVIHQKNQGICAARNAVPAIASGAYVAFVDSDDMVSPLLYERLVAVIEAENADWAACAYTRSIEKLATTPEHPTGTVHILHTREEQLAVLVCVPQIRDITWSSGYLWNKLYRKALITSFFPAGYTHAEDIHFNWDYIQNSQSLAIISLPLYFYRINDESITETYRKSSPEHLASRVFSLVQVSERIAGEVSVECPALKRYMIARTVSLMHGGLFRLSAHDSASQYPDFCTHAGKYIRKHWRTVWQEKETYDLRAKLPVALFKFAYPLWLLSTKLLNI